MCYLCCVTQNSILILGDIYMDKFKLPDVNKEYSVTKTFRLKSSLLEQLEKTSKEYNVSINRIITESIEFALKNLDKTDIKKENNNG